MRTSNGRAKRGQIDVIGLVVLRVRVRFKLLNRAVNTSLDISHRLFVYRENAVLGTGFNRHVADRKAVIHRQGCNAVTRKLHRPVQRAIDADFADDVQNDILTGDIFRQRTRQMKANRGRNLEPCLAGCHAGGQIGRTHTGGKRAQRTVGAGVRIRADNQLTRSDKALFRQQRMFNAHLADVKKVDKLMLFGKGAAGQTLLSRLDVLIRCKMIHYQRNFAAVKDLFKARLFHLTNGDRTCNIVCKRQIEICFDQLSCGDTVQPRMTRENFLRHGHSHRKKPPLLRRSARGQTGNGILSC